MTDSLNIGWREWITLPDLAAPWIRAKVDTGARTSALNTQNITQSQRGANQWVSFILRPPPVDGDSMTCKMPISEFVMISEVDHYL